MSDFRSLSGSVFASPQITASDLAEAKALGVTAVVNNRPDGEDSGQPTSAQIASEAEALGLSYTHIPITHSGFSVSQVDGMAALLEGTGGDKGGKLLAYCRSGTRSTLLWALAEAKRGRAPDEIAEAAANAGYDIGPIRAMVDALAAQTSQG